MYFDNLTIVGLTVASVMALLPLFFGKEMIRVQEDDTRASVPSPRQSGVSEAIPNEIECATETCQ
jgi:hypothetical protein